MRAGGMVCAVHGDVGEWVEVPVVGMDEVQWGRRGGKRVRAGGRRPAWAPASWGAGRAPREQREPSDFTVFSDEAERAWKIRGPERGVEGLGERLRELAVEGDRRHARGERERGGSAAALAASPGAVGVSARGRRPEDRSGDAPGSATSGKRGGGCGARWRGLLARRDLVDDKDDAEFSCAESAEHSPRSSFDIDEAPSFYSWDEPQSHSLRSWRSNKSLKYRPRRHARPRRIACIGRQACLDDLTEIVDAANEPCVSYDRQIFDPARKVWTYVEASQPTSSQWELGTTDEPTACHSPVDSPVTCYSVAGTEDTISSTHHQLSRVPRPDETRGGVPAQLPELVALPPRRESEALAAVPRPRPAAPSELAALPPRPEPETLAAVPALGPTGPSHHYPAPFPLRRRTSSSEIARRGYSRTDNLGPAVFEEIITASELDDS